MDDQDKQWYTNNDNVAVTTDASSSHMDVVYSASNAHLQNDANSNLNISDVSRMDFNVHSSHNRQLSRMSSEQALNTISDVNMSSSSSGPISQLGLTGNSHVGPTGNSHAEHSDRNRRLVRMSSEQALQCFLSGTDNVRDQNSG